MQVEEKKDKTNLATEDLIDGGALLERALGHHLGALLLHVQHERVEGLLHVGPVRLFLLALALAFARTVTARVVGGVVMEKVVGRVRVVHGCRCR